MDQSDKREYSKDEIVNLGLSDWELYVARNEIYARHGRGFRNKELQDYFDSCSWYKKTTEPDKFDQSVLSEVEIKNANLITEIEQERQSPYLKQ